MVAAGSLSGKAQVRQDGVWSDPVDGTVDTLHIDSIDPVSRPANTPVTITGTGFGGARGSGQCQAISRIGDGIGNLAAQAVEAPRSAPAAPDSNALTPATPMPVALPDMFFSVTKDTASGAIDAKGIDRSEKAHPVHLTLSGITSASPTGKAITMATSSPNDTNSITQPQKVEPVTSDLTGVSKDFTRTFPPNSITVLEFERQTGCGRRGESLRFIAPESGSSFAASLRCLPIRWSTSRFSPRVSLWMSAHAALFCFEGDSGCSRSSRGLKTHLTYFTHFLDIGVIDSLCSN